MLSALPSFVVGEFAVRGLGRMGISQVSSFMFLMPVLIFAWYYLIGWLLDRWISKRSSFDLCIQTNRDLTRLSIIVFTVGHATASQI
jgi:hypothetical protein